MGFKTTTPLLLNLLQKGALKKTDIIQDLPLIDKITKTPYSGISLLKGNDYNLTLYYDRTEPKYKLTTSDEFALEQIEVQTALNTLQSSLRQIQPTGENPLTTQIDFRTKFFEIIRHQWLKSVWISSGLLNIYRRYWIITIDKPTHIQVITESDRVHISYILTKRLGGNIIAGNRRSIYVESRQPALITLKPPKTSLNPALDPPTLLVARQTLEVWTRQDLSKYIPAMLKRYFTLTLTESKHVQVITESKLRHISVLYQNTMNGVIIAGNQAAHRILEAGDPIIQYNETVRSVIIDIADNWATTTTGYFYFLGIFSIEFYDFNNNLIPLTAQDFTAYATSTYGSYTFTNTCTSSRLKIGNWSNRCWLSASENNRQRLICVFKHPVPLQIAKIVINNGHTIGTLTYIGAKSTKIYLSPEIVTDTTYDAALSDADLIFDGVIPQHTASNIIDDYIITT